jgi:hypothetical protein
MKNLHVQTKWRDPLEVAQMEKALQLYLQINGWQNAAFGSIEFYKEINAKNYKANFAKYYLNKEHNGPGVNFYVYRLWVYKPFYKVTEFFKVDGIIDHLTKQALHVPKHQPSNRRK